MTSLPANYPAANAYTREDRLVPVWNRVSWGPIMMGAVCAIALQFVFTVLGIAMGTTAGESTAGVDGDSVRTIGVVAGLWWLITGTIALAVGGYVYGRLSGLTRSLPLNLGAAAMWGVVALFGFLVVWSGAGMLSEAASPIGAISAMSLDTQSSEISRGAASAEQQMASGVQNAGSQINTAAIAEAARSATRTASWWAVIGMLVGLVATMIAASTAVPAPVHSENRSV